jgi:hypothetical protein
MKYINIEKTHQNHECSNNNGLYNLGKAKRHKL